MAIPSPSTLHFVKMHGLGNDFVLVDQRAGARAVTPALARRLGDRHRGVGFDQLVEIDAADGADARLRFWNADGSLAGACGNGTRCAARLLMDQTGRNPLRLLTDRGMLEAGDAGGGMTTVNMGPPLLDWQDIPLARAVDTLALPLDGAPVAVGMGNPHCVFFVADAEAEDIARRGAAVETDPLFPDRTNVEFVSLLGTDLLRLRVWERGAGVTLACGSGACAAAVAAHRRGLTARKVEIVLDGGSLWLDWRDDGVWMTGPTAVVFHGEMEL